MATYVVHNGRKSETVVADNFTIKGEVRLMFYNYNEIGNVHSVTNVAVFYKWDKVTQGKEEIKLEE